MDLLDQFVVTTLRSATPIIIAALAGLFSIRAGVFNVGIEGLMLAGAFTAVAGGVWTGSVALSLLLAVLVCLLLSFVYWGLIERFKADAVIAGLGLTTFCIGATAFLMQTLFGRRGSFKSPVRLPIPVSGVHEGPWAYVSELSILTWLLPVFLFAAWIVLRRSRLGLQIAAVGDYPYGAEVAGLNLARVRLYAVLITGFGSALAGAELAIGDLASFTDNMTNGRGFIALAAILFGLRSPFYTALAGLFFGFADALGIVFQIKATGAIPREFVLMAPFVATIVIVTLSSGLARRKRRR
jgi:general nucleoside transport system permease protein